MSSSIWTQCAGSSNLRPLSLRPWRIVEAQHIVSTRKLVDSDEEQQTLERLIESSKPRAGRIDDRGLHYLLFTPFRYPPLRHGSRFGRRSERGIWYGARELRTACAEVAYYRLLFLEGTRAVLPPLMTELSAFRVPVRTGRGIDLTAAPFSRFRAQISAKSSYADSQRLGREMREAGVEAFRYASARDADGGIAVGLISPRAFAASRPIALEAWHSVATREAVEVSRRDFFRRGGWRFARAQFEVDGRLPAPAP